MYRIYAVEIRNGRNFRFLNACASAFCSLSRIRGICGSDAHLQKNVGRAGMLLPDFSTADELRESIKKARPFGSGQSLLSSLKLLKKVF